MDINEINRNLQAAVAAFERQQFDFALSILGQVAQRGQIQGVQYLTACCHVALRQYHQVMPALRQELANFPGNNEAAQLSAQVTQVRQGNPTLARLDAAPAQVLLSGLAPGDSGTGRFLSTLLPLASRQGYQAIHSRHIGFHPAEKIAVATLRRASILILHPQTIGWDLVQSLYDAGNQLRFYILDNSFFCIRSFNYRPGKIGECLDCLGALSGCHPDCVPFPAPYEKSENLAALQWLQQHATEFEFFCQSNAQRDLVLRHFGEGTRAITVGMVPADLRPEESPKRPGFDLVFHADAHAAKGLHYTIELAKLLPELSVLLPCSEEELRASGYMAPVPPSVTVRPLRWDSGLREEVAAARLVLCPSQWSAAVEGALLKSLQNNGNVAVYKNSFGFSRELPGDVALPLGADLPSSAARVREFLSSGTDNRERARAWLASYVDSVDLERIFAESR